MIPSASMINRSAGCVIRRKRNELKISQNWIADEMGITRQQFGKYEKGYVTLTIFRIMQICDILGIAPELYMISVYNEAIASRHTKTQNPHTISLNF